MGEQYSCKCLNVRLQGEPSKTLTLDNFKRLLIQDEGVQIIHPQLTIRSRALANHEQRRIRHTTLTCLFCGTPVYRVTEDNPDTDLSEGHILQEDGEDETLRSMDGWIEVSSDCLTGPTLESAYSSSRYSTVFSILVPSHTPLRTSPQQESGYQPPPLDLNLPPLFLSPPFTPGHSVFVSVSRLATKASDDLRKQLRSELDVLVRQKLEKLEIVENELRRDVDAIWKQWREARSSINNEPDVPPTNRRHSGQIPTIKDFDPSIQSPSSSPPHVNRVTDMPQAPLDLPKVSVASLLSASLAQSSLHQYMASSDAETTSTTPPLELKSPPPGDADFTAGLNKRTAREDHAVAASYKIAMEDMAAFEAFETAQQDRIRKKLEKANAKMKEEGESHRGRALPEGKHVQFADAEDADATKADDDEPELFEFEPLARPTPQDDTVEHPETSITPHASPGPRKTALPSTQAHSPRAGDLSSPLDVSGDSRADKQLLQLVAAEAPSHRQAWKANGKGWDIFDGGRRIKDDSLPDEDDEESLSELTDKSEWKNPSVGAKSLPMAIGPLATYGLAQDVRQPKSSLADRPGILVPPIPPRGTSSRHIKLSSSVMTRERAYAARDLSISMDPGHSLHMPDSLDEVDEDDESITGGSETSQNEVADKQTQRDSSAERSRRRAQLILQKSVGSVAPDAAMWRSVAN